MQTHRLEIEIPEILMDYLQMDDEKIKNRIYKLLIIDLVCNGIISHGKAAELVGLDKLSFIEEIGRLGIPYFDIDISEIINDSKMVEDTIAGESV